MHTQHTQCTQGRKKVIFRIFFDGRGRDLEVGVVHLVVLVLDRLLCATTKKVVNFFEEKSAPHTKSWLRLCKQLHCRKKKTKPATKHIEKNNDIIVNQAPYKATEQHSHTRCVEQRSGEIRVESSVRY